MAPQFQKTLRISNGGRIVIPAKVRQQLDLDVGAEAVLTVEDDHVTIISAKAARRQARQQVRKCIKPGVSLSEELSAERKSGPSVR